MVNILNGYGEMVDAGDSKFLGKSRKGSNPFIRIQADILMKNIPKAKVLTW